jgi:beta-alanine--pyruvate transaminase
VQNAGGCFTPPEGYWRGVRQICDRYDILLSADEVITAFGRLGYTFAAERFGVLPDMITFAKGITSGAIPMGGVMVRQHIYDAFMTTPDHVIEFFHGYTYTGHPMAAAAGLATLELYKQEGLFERARKLENRWADAAMSLKGHSLVQDVRTIGLVAGIDMAPVPSQPGKRAYYAMESGFHEHDIMLRITGDTIALSPPLIISDGQIDEIFSKRLPAVLKSVESLS